MTCGAVVAGAPEMFDEVTLEGRFGIVLQRLDGPTLLQLLQTRSEQVGTILASFYTSVHRTPPPQDVVSLRDWIDAASQTSRYILPKHIVTGVLTLIDRLPPGDRLCHADLPPRHVIMTADSPRIIDGLVRYARPQSSTLRVSTSAFPSSPRKTPIRSRRAQSMPPCSPSTRD